MIITLGGAARKLGRTAAIEQKKRKKTRDRFMPIGL